MAAACAGMEPAAAAPPSPSAPTAPSPPSPSSSSSPSSPSPPAAPGSAELVCAQGRNLKAVLCQRCGSRVLLPGAATFARRELLLPAMRKKAVAAAANGGDVVREHWLVRDMFSFENVGFTRDVGNVKFLVCADCEAGPIGWHCLDDKDSFYVALERVAHE
ncbi:guanine nucleotide exchange factor MSS4 [Oxyura jamaicensis]|uniref:guanine nucleotide exchange factor MSS4 n=1 Tax=Oxyura jamaicensis TaxID=8884 RepID=UPI0015A4F810|nr:guanine nucleotide exchange factor MSS4 [Oxyura jamaicensis]